MTARSPAQRYWLRAAGALCGAGLLSGLSPGCYPSGGAGTQPPPDAFYYPVGLAVSSGGNVLYAVNSDFDLQWNGGTLQSYDLFRLRHDTAELINANFSLPLPPGANPSNDIQFLGPWPADGACMSPQLIADTPTNPNGSRVELGQSCSPPVNSNPYISKSAIIGAFATDLQLSRDGTRLFSPVRGDGTVTWADVIPDTQSPLEVPKGDGNIAFQCLDPGGPDCVTEWSVSTALTGPTAPDKFDCGSGADLRCNSEHHTGAVPDPADTRLATLPGEPFALGQTIDGTALVVTHQTADETSLLLSGLPPQLSSEMDVSPTADGGAPSAGTPSAPSPIEPSMQYVLVGVPTGGDGIVAVPHDPDAPVPPCELVAAGAPCVNPAFLETTHNAAEIDLLRYYSDDGSSVKRPFLVREAAYTLTANVGGTDSRDIAIDATPRQACKFLHPDSIAACAQRSARVFFASRTPPALVFGEIGEASESGSAGYDPDRLVITGNEPIANGGSRVYLAPIVDRNGRYSLRVFVVCFDAGQIFIWDPNAGVMEGTINVAPGPFAMAFDPFVMDDVADQAAVQADPRQDPSLNLKRYRFAYVASFTQSFVQVIDLDNSIPATSNTTFEQVVFTLGQPTNPKGS